MKKKIFLIVALCLIVIAGGVLLSLYILGDRIIDEVLNTEIAALPSESTVLQDTSEELDADMVSDEAVTHSADSTEPARETTEDSTKSSGAAAKAKPAISVEKINAVKDEVSAKDKVTAAALVVSKLSSEDIGELQGMLTGGLTAEEKAEAISIAYANFSSEEIAQIKEIYRKYMNK